MVNRYSSAGSFRYGFNGKEKDNEIKGEGNSYDYGERRYDSRIGRWLSLDPLQKKYPNESNYAYTSNNPIIHTDVAGGDKIWYLNVITKDGTIITVETKREINNKVHLHMDNGYNGPIFYSTDVKQSYTLDLRTNKWSGSKEESDYTSQRSYGEGLLMIAKSWGFGESETRGKQAGGWSLTSEFAKEADGPKTDATKGFSGSINIDLMLVAIGAATKENSIPDLKDGLGPAEFLNTIKELVETIKDQVKDNKGPSTAKSPNKSSGKSSIGYRVGTILYTNIGNVVVNPDSTETCCQVNKKATDTLPNLKKNKN